MEVEDNGNSAVLAQARDEHRRIEKDFLEKQGGKERIATVREDMQTIMEAAAGIYRNGKDLERARSS